MQLLEIKNDIAKILYSPLENHLLLADFLLIEDVNQSLIAQIIDIESSTKPDENIITVKFSLSINKNANLSTYNGYTPSKDARIIYIEPSEIAQLIQSPKINIFWGYLASHPSTAISLGLSFLREKPYIQCDKIDNATTLATNIVYGLQKNKKRTLIIDFDGRYKKIDDATKINISKEYKLPLNVEAFDFISENDLEDCSPENKAIIQGILLELQSYVATLKDQFIPFDIFKNVIDEECRKNPIPELIIFKNKLVKYQQKTLFAQSKEQFNFLNKLLSKKTTTIIDASEVDEKWHRFILEIVSSQITKKGYLIINVNDTNVNKRTIKTIYDNENIRPIVISPYNVKCSFQLKTICKNLILFAPIEKVNDFEIYSSFLHKLNQKEFIIWSENTFYMPLILKLRALDKDYLTQAISQEIKSDVDRMFTADSSLDKNKEVYMPEEIIVQPDSEDDTANKHNMNEKIIRAISAKDKKSEEIQSPETQVGTIKADELTEEDLDFLDGINSIETIEEQSMPKVETYTIIEEEEEENIDSNTVEIIEQLPAENPITNKITIETPDIEQQQEILTKEPIIEEESVEQLLDEAPIVNEEVIQEEITEPQVQEPEIEEIPQIQESEETIEEPKKIAPPTAKEATQIEEASTIIPKGVQVAETATPSKPPAVEPKSPAVEIKQAPQSKEKVPTSKKTLEQKIIEKKKASLPIYEAKTAEQDIEPIKFKEGNFVYHAKYGKGIIEKIITYGNKTLCSIEFDNIGRRLLDPNLADIKLV